MNGNDSPGSARGGWLGPTILGMAALGTVLAYYGFYSPQLNRAVESGLPNAEHFVYLRIHILAYCASYLLLVAALVAAIVDRRQEGGRVPWVAAAYVTASALAILGLTTGDAFALPTWGHIPRWSDPKLLWANITGWALLLLGSPIVLWAHFRLDSTRRRYVVIVVLVTALALCIASIVLGRLVRSIHPVTWWLRV